jgi:phosphohistidine swiveling domain-containing protein
VTAHVLSAGDDSELCRGARRLLALLRDEAREQGAGAAAADLPAAAYVEYARLPGGAVWFLQARPAPASAPSQWPSSGDAGAETSSDGDDLVYLQDEEHNPDPLSRAQTGLVEEVADLAPTLRQRVFAGYLYYAVVPGAPAPARLTEPAELGERYAESIVPACEALLRPLERGLLAEDGALDPRLRADPSRCGLELGEALRAYRGVYRIYVAELSPALRQARGLLDEFLRQHLGESLHEHAALFAAAAESPTERLQELWRIGQALTEGAAEPGDEPRLRAYLARYGAYASSWDVAAPCDDERPDWVRDVARRLSRGPAPQSQRAAAAAGYKEALAALLGRLPAAAQDTLRRLLPKVRTAQRIAEEDDGLFFRAQRLLRWALLRRGALFCAAGRLDAVEQIFDLPWALQRAAEAEFRPERCAPGVDLRALCEQGKRARVQARALVPPARLWHGRTLALPAPQRTEVLRGHGVPGRSGGMVRGRARVVRSLFPPPGDAAMVSGSDEILVLPALLPSWSAELWRAQALVTDSGGALCHGAILARERGVPAVVGTRLATRAIADGQEVWVDAAQGRVYVLPLAPDGPSST